MYTGTERDVERGLDPFCVHYLSAVQGLFLLPHLLTSALERLRDPQQFNRYSYSKSNPLHFLDLEFGRASGVASLRVNALQQDKTAQELSRIRRATHGVKLLGSQEIFEQWKHARLSEGAAMLETS